MTYKFIIPTNGNNKLPSLNEYISAERQRIGGRGKFLTKGAVMKREWQNYISVFIRRDLRGVKIEKPVVIHYHYYEQNRKRDIGNIHAPCQKFVEDALQDCGVIINDNQRYLRGFTASFDVSKDNPRVEIEIEETE